MLGALTEWWERRKVLREFQRDQEGPQQPFDGYFQDQIDLAWTALRDGDPEGAYDIWRKAHRDHRELSLTSERGLKLIAELGRHDEAEMLTREGLRLYPRFRSIYAEVYALVARNRGDHQEAVRRFSDLRRQFPMMAIGYSAAALSLRELGHDAEAEAVIKSGIEQLPADFEMLSAYARFSERRRDWPETLRRWEAVRDSADHWLGPVGIAQTLCELGEHGNALTIARDAIERFPTDHWPYVAAADSLLGLGDLDGAIAEYARIRLLFPFFGVAYYRSVELARKAGREAEADEILEAAVSRMRFDLGLHLDYARSADRRGDQAESKTRWSLVRSRFPDCAEAQNRGEPHPSASP
jgi:tetratricopeptide (TPR) repeat protein